MGDVIIQKNGIKFVTVDALEKAFEMAASEKNYELMQDIHKTQMFLLEVANEVENESLIEAINVLNFNLRMSLNHCDEDDEQLAYNVIDMCDLAKAIGYLKDILEER